MTSKWPKLYLLLKPQLFLSSVKCKITIYIITCQGGGSPQYTFSSFVGEYWWEPILWEDNLWFASFEGGKSGGRVSWWVNIWWFSSHPHFFPLPHLFLPSNEENHRKSSHKIGSLPTKWRKGLLILLAPCQWGSHPDSYMHKLMVNYSMIRA